MDTLYYYDIPQREKTESTSVIKTLLKNNYNLIECFDHQMFDVSIKKGDLFLFFQRPPSENLISRLEGANLIYIPMYDEARNYSRSTIRSWASLKIVNFCKAMNDNMKKWGFNCFYTQYYPKPEKTEIDLCEMNRAFYWRRESCYINEAIPPQLVKRIVGNNPIKLHVHSETRYEDERDIVEMIESRSTWFKEKSDMIKILRGCSMYLAPRESEGIGLSFLEAMANGLAVVGADNPTINEYITDGVNGYLYNLLAPRPLDIKNISEVRKRSLESCAVGYERWEQEKWDLLKFIDEPAKGKTSVAVPKGFLYNSLKLAKPSFRLKRMAKRILGK